MMRIACIFCLSFATHAAVAIQDKGGGTEVTTVTANVVDLEGRVIHDLTATDFVVEEDGVKQVVSECIFDQSAPVSFGLLIDRSGSMAFSLKTALKVAAEFVRTMRPEDEMFLSAFALETRKLVAFTSDTRKLLGALSGKEFWTVGQATSLYPALQDGFRQVRRGKNRKRIVIVFTDGLETQHSMDEWISSVAVNAEVPLYGVGIVGLPPVDDYVPIVADRRNADAGSIDVQRRSNSPAVGPTPQSRPANAWELQLDPRFAGLAAETGGRVFAVPVNSGPEELIGRSRATALDLAADIRGEYILGYSSVNQSRGLRKIRVTAKNPDYRVRARQSVLRRPRQ